MLLYLYNFMCETQVVVGVYWESHEAAINSPYPEPVYTGWSSVHWNATGMPLVDPVYTGRPSEYLQGTLEHHWKNLVETAPHWNATGET